MGEPVNKMERNLRDLLELAVGEPPRLVNIQAVRRRAVRRRVLQVGGLSLAAVLLAGAGVTVASGAIHTGTPAASRTHGHAGPPPYYFISYYDPTTRQEVSAIKATATGRQTAIVRDPSPGYCGGGNVSFAAAYHQTFFMICTPRGPLESLIYRFRVTGSGRVTGYSLVKGGVLKGVLAENIAAAPDASKVAVEVLRPGPSGHLYTNSIPEGIFVISTATGARALWHTGPYRPGTIQYSGATNMSFAGGDNKLVVLEARCHRSRYLTDCNGKADMQVRAYSPAARGGSLEGGRILLRGSTLKPRGTFLSDAVISPDGSSLTAALTDCPRHGACTLTVARISVVTGRVTRVLYVTHSGSAFQGIFFRFFSTDPSVRYVILDAGAGHARVNGWIDHGKLVPLNPANGNIPDYETW